MLVPRGKQCFPLYVLNINYHFSAWVAKMCVCVCWCVCVSLNLCVEGVCVSMKRRGPHPGSQNPAEELVWDRDVPTAPLRQDT